MVDDPSKPPPPPPKPIGDKSIFQKVISQQIFDGKMEILLQIEIDCEGNSVVTVFKGRKVIDVTKDPADPTNPGNESGI